MRYNTMDSFFDSPNPESRPFTLTPLGFEACAWIEDQERQNEKIDWGNLPVVCQDDQDDQDEFAFTCPHCHLLLSNCECE